LSFRACVTSFGHNPIVIPTKEESLREALDDGVGALGKRNETGCAGRASRRDVSQARHDRVTFVEGELNTKQRSGISCRNEPTSSQDRKISRKLEMTTGLRPE